MEVFTYLILGVREILPVQLSLKYSILECTRHQCICMKFVHKSIKFVGIYSQIFVFHEISYYCVGDLLIVDLLFLLVSLFVDHYIRLYAP